MLTLQPFTFQALNQLPFDLFKSDIKAFLRKHYSREISQLGEAQTDTFVAHVVDTAFDYGYHTQRPIYYLASLMMLFGSHCDKDFQLPWIHQMLTDYSIESGSQRMEALWQHAITYLSDVSGDENQHLIRAFIHIKRINYDELNGLDLTSYTTYIHTTLQTIYPQKYHAQGSESIDALISHTQEMGQQYNIVSLGNQAFLVGMLFLMGSHSANDILYPWFKTTLRQDTDEHSRTQILREQALQYIEAALVAEA